MMELDAYYKGSVGFLALEATLMALEMKSVVVRAGKSKDACQCPRCRIFHTKRVSELQVEIADFVEWCKEAKAIEDSRLRRVRASRNQPRLAERKEV